MTGLLKLRPLLVIFHFPSMHLAVKLQLLALLILPILLVLLLPLPLPFVMQRVPPKLFARKRTDAACRCLRAGVGESVRAGRVSDFTNAHNEGEQPTRSGAQ